MKLICVSVCRNEAWTVEAMVRSALRWVDDVLVLDHASTDRTPDILAGLAQETGRVTLLREPEPLWRDMAFKQRLLVTAREMGGTHIAILDADEILTANLLPVIRPMIESLEPRQVLEIPWIQLWRSLDRYRDDRSNWSRSFASMAVCDAPELYWAAVAGYEHHHHRYPFNGVPVKRLTLKEGGLLHYQHANWRRLMAKQTWYQMYEMVRWPHFGAEAIHKRYRGTYDETGLSTAAVPDGWWGPERELIRLDNPPWQEEDMQRMIMEKGSDYFKGVLK